jgi:7,8-dihydropterin-6-yl-methyl-4-(beta-D-ribofuranosyl)aminobenzene 5'-phosphate synthase
MPEGNQHLFIQDTQGHYIQDDFRHELALYTDGLLFTGCAHSGLENILAACPFPVNEVVGGFHLLDGYETEEELLSLAHRLRTNYPHTQFYTSHCTGDLVFSTLQRIMGNQIHPFSCGSPK